MNIYINNNSICTVIFVSAQKQWYSIHSGVRPLVADVGST